MSIKLNFYVRLGEYYVNRIVKCPYCLYEYELDDSWMKDGFGLIHECVNCEEEYLITKTEVNKYK